MRLFLSMVALALLAVPANADEFDSAVKEVVGVWKLDFVTPEGDRLTPMVVVGRQHQELVAWVADEEKGKLQAFEDVCLKDDSVVATIKPKEYGGDVTVTLEARLEEKDACCGKAKYALGNGESGTFDFTGERIPVSKLDDVSQWDVSFETPDFEQHKALVTLVTVGEKEYGWYSSKDYELPILEAKTDGDRVVVSLTAKTVDGTKVDVTFRGTVNGDRVEGTAEFNLDGETGDFNFSAKQRS